LETLVGLIRRTAARSVWADKAAATAASVLVALFCAYTVLQAGHGLRIMVPQILDEHAQVYQDNQSVYEWIRKSTPADARFLSYIDGLLYLHTGRQAGSMKIPPIMIRSRDGQRLRKYLERLPEVAERFGLNHVLMTGADYSMDDPERVRPLLLGTLDRYQLPEVHRDGDAVVYEIPDSIVRTAASGQQGPS
jgi:hypothetical protein